jgi:hypothetical protein
MSLEKKDTINNVTPKIKPMKQIYIINGLTPIGHPFKVDTVISKPVN